MLSIVRYTAYAVFLLSLLELAAYLLARAMVPLALVLPPPTADGYEEYLQYRDPVLGWPRPDSFGREELDNRGSRVASGLAVDGDGTCVAAYGDSFTWGAEVDADQAYPAVLSTLLGCRVDNFGVGGYGTDQALIRYKMNSSDVAETVLLGHFSDNIVRNVNQLRDLYAYSRFGFKPRFILSQTGELVLVPLPHLGRDDYLRLYENVEELLPHEFFAPNSAGAAFVMGFPYSRTVLRALSHYRVRYILRDEPSYQGFYNPTHESHALAVTGAILLRFVKEVQNRSQVGHILLIPDIKDLHSLSRHGSAAYDPLVEFLAVHNVAAIDVGRLILQQHPAVDPCEWYTRCRGSHFNADGYALLARIVHEHLTSTR